MADSFDFVVIGGGSGGIAAARRAASHGASVALVEKGRLGGTCVNVGCVPKKVMFNAAHMAESLADAAGYGFHLEPAKFDWAKVKSARDAYVDRLGGIYWRNLDKAGVRFIEGRGRFVGKRRIAVGDREIEARHVLIATGGRPRIPDVPGAEIGITSDGFFALEEQPKRVAIVGAGYIAVELAGMLAALGSEVTLFIRFEEFLRGFDAMVRQELMSQMEAAGVRIQRCEFVASVGRTPQGIVVATQSVRTPSFHDCLIWAVGRTPMTADLGLDVAGVEIDEDGYVVADDYQNTSAEGVHAVGDVTGRIELTPVAIAAGRHLADRLFGGKLEAHLDYENVPSVIFSCPPIGTVGLTEEAARERYGDSSVRVYTSSFVNLYHALTERRPKSRVKLVVVGDRERVVGLHVIGLAADELVQGFAVAINMGATKADFDRTVAVHPTAAEEVVTLR